jgi:hypothetical protein
MAGLRYSFLHSQEREIDIRKPKTAHFNPRPWSTVQHLWSVFDGPSSMVRALRIEMNGDQYHD